MTTGLSGLFGFLFIIGLLFGSASSVDNIVSNELNVDDIFTQCAGQGFGLTLAVFITIMTFFAGVSSQTVTSRAAFSMARDGKSHHDSY